MTLHLYWLAWILFLLDNGVSGVDTEGVSVNEGDSVTLYTGVKTNQQEDIKWYFNKTRIAQISEDLSFICTDVQCNNGTERFRDRLKLDHQTGSLTITNISNTDSGLYELNIISKKNSEEIFNVTVSGVSAAERDEVKKNQGDATLDAGEIRKPNDSMTWYYNEILIAEITGDQSKICTDVQCDERFRDRLKLDHQTGSLNITNTRTTDSGEYKLQIISESNRFSVSRVKRFNVSFTGSDLSSGAVAGIVVAVLLLAAVLTAGVIYYRRKGYAPVQRNMQKIPKTNNRDPAAAAAAEINAIRKTEGEPQ